MRSCPPATVTFVERGRRREEPPPTTRRKGGLLVEDLDCVAPVFPKCFEPHPAQLHGLR